RPPPGRIVRREPSQGIPEVTDEVVVQPDSAGVVDELPVARKGMLSERQQQEVVKRSRHERSSIRRSDGQRSSLKAACTLDGLSAEITATRRIARHVTRDSKTLASYSDETP